MSQKPESKLVTKILTALRNDGWLVTKTHGGAYSDAGVPDILGWRAGKALALEVKAGSGTTTALQERWLKQLAEQGVLAGVVRSVEDAKGIAGGNN